MFNAFTTATICTVPEVGNVRSATGHCPYKKPGLMHLFPLRSPLFTKLPMLFLSHAARSVYTVLYLRAFDGVVLLVKYINVLQAELGVCKLIGPPDLVPNT